MIYYIITVKTFSLYIRQALDPDLWRRSLPSPGYSIWNPWNHCWLRPQPIYCSMDIMDSMWNDHGIWAYPPWIPWNKSIWILLKFHMENTMIFVVKNSVKYEN